MSIGPWQVAIIALIVLLLFGGKRLGSLGKGLGEGIRNFKKGIKDEGAEAEGETGETAETGEGEKGKGKGKGKGKNDASDLLKAAGEVAKVGSELRKATKVSRLLR